MTAADRWPVNYDQVETPLFASDTFPVQQLGGRTGPDGRQLALVSAFVSMSLLVFVLFGISSREYRDQFLQGAVGVAESESLAGYGPANSGEEPVTLPSVAPMDSTSRRLTPVFAKPVMYWESQILTWSNEYGVDPDMTAIIMQIESCGDPMALSSAGARGLFQVMPFHFNDMEDSFNPDTNAFRGLSYFVDRLTQTNGDVGRAFAGYNGGHVAAGGSWDSWASETQRYYTWSTGIYDDIRSGLVESPTLASWMAAGGAGLCQQAANRLGI